MSKFGELINQAKEQKTNITENLQTGNTVKQKTGKQENRKAGFTESRFSETGQNENEIKSVNLSIKVPETLRRHWVAEAKREGTSITAEVTEALTNRFGSPGNR